MIQRERLQGSLCPNHYRQGYGPVAWIRFRRLGPGDDATRAIGEFNGLNLDRRALMVNEARQESGGGRARRGGGRGFSGGRGGRGGGGRRSY